MAELLGKSTGTSKGKGGSMHLADVNRNFWGGHAVVGAHLPIATGIAFADMYRKSDALTICMFGDGATNIGFFHEALNLSKVWNLPVLWVCENNQYGMGTAVERASATKEMRQKAEGYNMPNDKIDGMNLMKVREIALEKMEFIRGGGGPFFLEIITYRFRGHSMGDPERYRKPEEIKKWQENDPIGIYRSYLIDKEIASEGELDDQDVRVEGEVREAIEFAENSPEPEPEALFEDIYAE
jgi:pyruvate dehydrogenase E1 component alpha subunit